MKELGKQKSQGGSEAEETEVEWSGTVSRKGSEAWERREKKSEPRLSQNGVVVGTSE